MGNWIASCTRDIVEGGFRIRNYYVGSLAAADEERDDYGSCLEEEIQYWMH